MFSFFYFFLFSIKIFGSGERIFILNIYLYILQKYWIWKIKYLIPKNCFRSISSRFFQNTFYHISPCNIEVTRKSYTIMYTEIYLSVIIFWNMHRFWVVKVNMKSTEICIRMKSAFRYVKSRLCQMFGKLVN